MSNILVRDVPAEVHAALQVKAQRRRQSLQQYLVGELERLAERRSVVDVLDEVESRTGERIGLAAAVADLDEERRAR